MILPITVYGNSKLRKVSQAISTDYEGLETIILNMYETMYKADGVGLAAPQIGLNIRLFIVDASPAAEDEPELKDFKKAFINPEILDTDGEPYDFEEGCLSLPNIREDVKRPEQVTIKYFDENWIEKTETYNGFAARVIQHEYDHLEGKLFIDKISPLRKRLLKSKLIAISKGKTNIHYKIQVPGK